MSGMRKLWIAAGAVLLLSAAVGCSRAARSPEAADEYAPIEEQEAGAVPGEAADEAGEPTGVGAVVSGAQLPPVGAHVIKTAEVRLEVEQDRLEDAVGEVEALAGRYGGFIVSTSVGDEGAARATLVLRIPAERFEQALADVRRLGSKVVHETVSGQDVGQEFIDLEARLRNWGAQEVVLLRLMDRAQTVTDTIKVQRELQQVQLEMERIRGRLRYLEDQTAMGTVTVGLAEAGAAGQGEPGTLAQAWRRAVEGFLAVVSAVIVGAGFVFPLAILAGLAWLVVSRVVRARPAPAGPPAGT